MLSAAKTSRACLAALVALAASALIVLALASPSARALSIGELQQRIQAGQSQASSLAGSVGAESAQLAQLGASIDRLQRQIDRLQAELSVHQAQLIRLQIELTQARNRLAQLEAFEARAESVLARQLVNSYEQGQPDLVSVVLESNGFQDLLERLAFAQRIQTADAQVIRSVRRARRQVAAEAVRLGALEVREQELTTQILNERNALAGTQASLIRERAGVARARAAKASQLASVRARVAGLQQQLQQAEAAQAGGGFVFPLPVGAASPPSTWSPDQGVDISAPGDTPEYAVCSGTIVLHGIGGFGPWAPVLHCDSPIDGYSYVYYGHAGPANQLPVGTHVGAGQVM